MRGAVWAVIAVVAAGVVALLAIGLQGRPDAHSSPIVNRPAPSFSLPVLNGGRISLRSERGRPVVLNFFASWCDSCRVDHPEFVQEWRRYAPRGVTFLAVMYQDTPSGARGFLRKYGSGPPVLNDASGATAIDYGVTGVPETVVIDRDGVVREKVVGNIVPASLEQELDQLLRARA